MVPDWIYEWTENLRLLVFEWLGYLTKAIGIGDNSNRLESLIASPKAASRNKEIERRLRDYPNELISSLGWDTGDETEAADEVLKAEVSDSEKRKDLSKRLATSFRQIRGYQTLCSQVEQRRVTRYDAKNREHEQLLMKLWKLLMPDEELEARKTFQWQKIGFQGDDPATDFRGMGILGLDQLIFFAQFDFDNCRRLVSIANHPRNGFPYAICGISITHLVWELLNDKLLQNHFYNIFEQKPSIDAYHQAYCRIFTLFGDFWLHSDPANVMEYNVVNRQFHALLENYLERPDANLVKAKLEDILPDI